MSIAYVISLEKQAEEFLLAIFGYFTKGADMNKPIRFPPKAEDAVHGKYMTGLDRRPCMCYTELNR